MAKKPTNKSKTTTTAKKHTAVPVKSPAMPAVKTKAIEVTAAAPVVPAAKAIETTPVKIAPVQSAPQIDIAAVTQAISSLQSSDADIARDAASILGTLGSTAAVEPLIAALNNDNGYFHSVVRAAAAASLGQLSDARALEPLMNAVRDPQAEPSAEAIRALAAIGDARAISTLIDVIRNPSGFYLPIARRAAVIALGRFRSEEAISELRSVASAAWEDLVIREAAENALQSDRV
jgi:HEAT repeat protein